MPTYEYQCKACGNQLEAFQKMSDEPLKDCPKCNQSTLTKLVSASNFQLKGTGWYATDFKDKGKPPAAKSAQADEKSAGEGSSAPDKATKDSKSTEKKSDKSSNSSTTE